MTTEELSSLTIVSPEEVEALFPELANATIAAQYYVIDLGGNLWKYIKFNARVVYFFKYYGNQKWDKEGHCLTQDNIFIR